MAPPKPWHTVFVRYHQPWYSDPKPNLVNHEQCKVLRCTCMKIDVGYCRMQTFNLCVIEAYWQEIVTVITKYSSLHTLSLKIRPHFLGICIRYEHDTELRVLSIDLVKLLWDRNLIVRLEGDKLRSRSRMVFDNHDAKPSPSYITI